MDEQARLAALQRYEILDTATEPAFDAIARVAARALDVPIALISLVDADRQWCKASVGADLTATARGIGFCAHAIERDEVFVVEDARADARFADSPLVTGPPHVRSYAGAPLITPEGHRLGTVCALDRRPRAPTAAERATLVDLAGVVVELLEARLATRQQRVLAKISALSADGAYVHDLVRGCITWQSDRAPAVFGFDPRREQPADVYALVHPDDRATARTILQPGPGGRFAPVLYRVRDQDSYRWLLSRRAALDVDADGTVRTIVGVVSDVTELKRAEERTRASEHALAERLLVLEGILDAAAHAIMYADASGTIRLLNRYAREIVGDSAAEPDRAARIRDTGVHDGTGTRLLTPAELPLARALRGELVDAMPFVVRNPRFPDGLRLLANVRMVRTADDRPVGAVLSLVDVTETERARQRLLDANQNLLAVIDALPIGLFVHRGEILYANPALARLLGRGRDAMVGQPYTTLIDPADRDLLAARLHPPIDLRMIGSEGVVVFEVNAIEIQYDDRPATLVMCRDPSVERAAARQVRESLREKEALLREIHHRVKNNLAVVGSLLFLQAEAIEEPQARAALRAARERVYAIALAHEHLYRTSDLAAVELGAYLEALVAHLVASQGASQRGIEVRVEHPAPVAVELDAALPCGLIVNELVTNALKYAFPDRRPGSIVVTIAASADTIDLSIRDDGVGMAAAGEHAAGIGMQLVGDLVEQLQGTLTVTATGAGTRAAVAFPRTP